MNMINEKNWGESMIQLLWHSPSTKTMLIMRNCTLVVLASLIFAISSKIQIPFYPVPITMQTFVMFVIGMAYGWKLGLASVLLYLFQGLLGLPVFAGTPEKGIGLLYILGPTGGYLLGLALGVVFCGLLAEKLFDRTFFKIIFTMFFANVIVYIPGLLWLGYSVGWSKPLLEWGLYPFIIGDLFKITLAAVSLPFIWKFIRKYK